MLLLALWDISHKNENCCYFALKLYETCKISSVSKLLTVASDFHIMDKNTMEVVGELQLRTRYDE